mmetsp:Transcript_54430/g.126957  ORF Transcript_54430/g.126957 Transcript_54430/m.126957 type:complete len:107 (-) Transcript_54430:98-418(-)
MACGKTSRSTRDGCVPKLCAIIMSLFFKEARQVPLWGYAPLLLRRPAPETSPLPVRVRSIGQQTGQIGLVMRQWMKSVEVVQVDNLDDLYKGLHMFTWISDALANA